MFKFSLCSKKIYWHGLYEISCCIKSCYNISIVEHLRNVDLKIGKDGRPSSFLIDFVCRGLIETNVQNVESCCSHIERTSLTFTGVSDIRFISLIIRDSICMQRYSCGFKDTFILLIFNYTAPIQPGPQMTKLIRRQLRYRNLSPFHAKARHM